MGLIGSHLLTYVEMNLYVIICWFFRLGLVFFHAHQGMAEYPRATTLNTGKGGGGVGGGSSVQLQPAEHCEGLVVVGRVAVPVSSSIPMPCNNARR